MMRVTFFALATVVATTLAAPSKLPSCAHPCAKSVYDSLRTASHCRGRADLDCLCPLGPYRDGLVQCYETQKCNAADKLRATAFHNTLCSPSLAGKGQTNASEPSTPVTKKGESKAPGGGQGHEGESTFNTFNSKKSEEQHKVNKLAQDPERRPPPDEKHGANEHPSIGNSQDGPARSSSQTGKSVEHAEQTPLVNSTTHPHHSPSPTGHEGQHSKTPTPLRKTDKQHQTSGHTSPAHQSPPIGNPSIKKPLTEAKPTPKSKQSHKTEMPPSETRIPNAPSPTGKKENSPGKEKTKTPAQTHKKAPAQTLEKAPAQTFKKAPAGDGPTIGNSSTGSSDPTKKPVQDLPGGSAPQNQSVGSKPPPTSNPAAANSESLQTQTSNNTNGGPGTTGGQSPPPPPASRGAPAYILGSWTCLITLGTVTGAAWTMI
ncbi:BZ3500_MvSof-1268-A1-R1_Chr1-3g01915 [Microbotryum saponariae]|uniref:BZ3500_MvSof-1268-A1-R1_Chr1-3g01915 protein n=1 Tax=Microbotryum saponariae TaxID=289078 RepID=A0A2X0KVL0_9BASI|nr:BZ3500_MvSof-1268-A1-R1_Chr1-3g01915 [Microbotryum saponariae]SCZ94891.1 BZ3501_MvSof-1269-A2-R1_Chr1-3g01517 [Microbotryum saponariae]